ncbi:sialidase family protein [uncultured Clostridium sp.]|uniref:sialidase family protein n=1 Tax=uncultured Clostridium sp. TaxID=59620 RepID=UPI002064072B|nr:sialidase family protein [uncultured Clostridium sp.]DAP53315.1 MAG TPA: hypothetical protein [Caudoviricetes sp.]
MAKDLNSLPDPGSRIEEFLEYLAYNNGTGGNSGGTITSMEFDKVTNNLTITNSDGSKKTVDLSELKTEWDKLNHTNVSDYFFNLVSEGKFMPGILNSNGTYESTNRDWVNIRFKVKAGHTYRIVSSARIGTDFASEPLVCQFFAANDVYVSSANWTKSTDTIYNGRKYAEITIPSDIDTRVVYGSCNLRIASDYNEREELMIWDVAESVEPTEYVKHKKGGINIGNDVNLGFKSRKDLSSTTVQDALDEINNKSKADTVLGVKVFDVDDNVWDSIYFRIPSLLKTKNGSWLAFADIRHNTGSDHAYIENGCAKSVDGGKTWSYKISAENDNVSKVYSRVMDSTSVVTHTGRIINILGAWNTNEKWTLNTSAIPKADWRVVQAISDDEGETWRQVEIHTGNKVILPNSVSQGYGGIRGWIGGVGTGIVMKHSSHRNRIIMPIQVSFGNNEVRSGCIYSDNNGDSWTMCSQFADSNTSENMILELNDGSLIMTARRDSSVKARGAYISTDGGETWNVYTPLHGKFTHGGADRSSGCQGSWIKYDSINGDEIGLLSHPKNNTETWKRDNITIYMYNFTRPSMGIVELLVPYPQEGNPDGAGYSSMCYAENKDGKKTLGIIYEDLGSITFKDITYLLTEIDKLCLKSGGDVSLDGRNEFTGSVEFNRSNNAITGNGTVALSTARLDDNYYMGYRTHILETDDYIGNIKIAIHPDFNRSEVSKLSIVAVELGDSMATDKPYEILVEEGVNYTVKTGTGFYAKYIEISVNKKISRRGYLLFKVNMGNSVDTRPIRTTHINPSDGNYSDPNSVHLANNLINIHETNGSLSGTNTSTKKFMMIYEIFGIDINVEKTLIKLINGDLIPKVTLEEIDEITDKIQF